MYGTGSGHGKEEKEHKENITEPLPAARNKGLQTDVCSARTIKLLININGVGDLKNEINKDKTGLFHIYIYPPEGFNTKILLKDSINYFLKQGVTAGDRRVAFLFRTDTGCFSFVVQCTGLNKAEAETLRAVLIARGMDTADKILAVEGLADCFMRLYSNINCWVLGIREEPTLRNQLIEMMQLAYAKASLRFGAVSTFNLDIDLIERTLSILKGDEVREINYSEMFLKYKIELINTFRELSLSNVKCKEAAESLSIIFKYSYLEKQRKELSGQLDVNKNNLNVLESVQNKYKQTKTAVFRKKIDINVILDGLGLEALSQILQIEGNSSLLPELRQTCNHYAIGNKKWENELAKKITDLQVGLKRHKFLYVRHYAGKAVNFLYENSLVAVGSKLLPALCKPLIPHFAARILPIKKYLMKTATTLSNQLPPRLAKRTHEAVNVVLNNMDIESLLRVAGASAGGAYYYTSNGFYELMRQMLVVTIMFKVSNYLTQPILDDDHAKAIEKIQSGYFKDPKTLFNAINLAVTLIETACSKDYQYAIITVVGTASSVGISALTTWVCPDLALMRKHVDEEQIIIARLFVHFAGQRLGQHLARSGVELFSSKKAYQKAIDQFLLYLGTPEGVEQYPNASVYIGVDLYRIPFTQRLSLLDSFWHWFNQEPPILTVECAPPQRLYFSAACKVLVSASEAIVTCDPPVPLNPIRNPLFARALT
jgi:hypothetical protein